MIPVNNNYLMRVGLFAALSLFTTLVTAQNYVLDSDTWARPRSARAVAMMPSVKQVVQDWMRTREKRIEIRYPGGEVGNLWALELRDWLVALGIPSAVITLRVGSPNADELLLAVLS